MQGCVYMWIMYDLFERFLEACCVGVLELIAVVLGSRTVSLSADLFIYNYVIQVFIY